MNRIFVQELGLPKGSVRNSTPLPDFGGLHPDPNLTYAKDLVDEVKKSSIDFAAAADGDGDRAMFLDYRVFINPCDSVACTSQTSDDEVIIPLSTRRVCALHSLLQESWLAGFGS